MTVNPPLSEISKYLGQTIELSGEVRTVTMLKTDDEDETELLENGEYRVTLLVRPNGLDA